MLENYINLTKTFCQLGGIVHILNVDMHANLTRQQKDQYDYLSTMPQYITNLSDLIIIKFLVNRVTRFRKVFIETFKVHF